MNQRGKDRAGTGRRHPGYGNRAALLCLWLLLAVCLTGCWDRKELNDLALVMGTGLDLTEDGKLELSVQLFLSRQPGGSGSAQGAGGNPNTGQTVVQSAIGLTVADAETQLQEQLSRQVFWGHCEVFIFGEELANRGISDHLDFLHRQSGPRGRAHVFVSQGPAKAFLAQQSQVERNTSEALREMAISQTGLNVTMKQISQMLGGPTQAAALPLIEMTRKPNTERPVPYLGGTAVLKKGKLIGTLDDQLTRGILWIQNQAKNAIITFEPEKDAGYVSVKILENHTSLKPSVQGSRLTITVTLTGNADIKQNASSFDVTDFKKLEQLENGLNEALRRRITASLKQVQKNMKADCVGFADAFQRFKPDLWKKTASRWNELFPDVAVQVNTQIRIRHHGYSGKKMEGGPQ